MVVFQLIADHIVPHATALHAVPDPRGDGTVLRVHENQNLHLLSLVPNGWRRRVTPSA